MKKILIMTLHKATGDFHKQELRSVFKDIVQVDSYHIENNDRTAPEADLLVISSHVILDEVKPRLEKDTDFVIMKRTPTMEGLNKLREIKPGSRIMLVNSSPELAVEVIAQIYESGFRDIDFVPVYPDMDKIPPLDIAVTPGEIQFVPERVTKIINMENRIIDLSTVVDITARLNLNLEETQQIINSYVQNVAPLSCGMKSILDRSNALKTQLETILGLTSNGIIAVNTEGIITTCNNSAEKLFGINKNEIIGRNINKVLPEVELDKVLKTGEGVENELIKASNKNIVIENHPLRRQNELIGAISFCREFYEMEEKQQKLRNQVISKGHVAKYTFKNIVGQSKAIIDAKKIARKMARSNSTVLICGESGTGKELFAQAIHNASARSKGPFVALNCSTLSENLLESELFGYAEGAFTGARKKGKMGLFELAHGGTIFLDEIGEVSLKLQSKLLRVLEEREIRRVGGDSVKKIDVRVIAATNRNLKKLLRKKEFREDLYYRLNILPLQVPSLRERKEDIPLLITHFLREKGYKGDIPKRVLHHLIYHNWPGNIRELENCIEYVVQMAEGEIQEKDLPDYVLNKGDVFAETNTVPDELFEDRVTFFILNLLYDASITEERMGRRTIYRKAKEKGFTTISEHDIRKRINTLAEHGLVKIKRGRGGTVITPKGASIIKGNYG